MEDAWQSDMAPSNGPGHGPMNTDDQGWHGNGGGASPRERDGDRDSRRNRSRSPGREGGRAAGGGENPGNNLHVSSLSHRVDQRELEAAFSKIGRVQKASIMYDPHTRESRGFAFVTMETAEEAEAAIAALNATDLLGKVMNVEKARRGRARTPTPGRYKGPHKSRREFERPYDPRPYDSRYSRGDRDRDRDRDYRGGGGMRREDSYRRDDYRDRDRERDRDRDYDRGDRDRDRGGDRYGGRREDRGGRDYDRR